MYRDLDTAKNFATVTNMKITAQSEKSAEMSAIALKKHAATRAKEQVAKELIKTIWDQHNWASYAECADYIHKNALVGDLNHRKIYSLVSKVAKEKS
jgi:tricorn protease-like protein